VLLEPNITIKAAAGVWKTSRNGRAAGIASQPRKMEAIVAEEKEEALLTGFHCKHTYACC
jgi:hypothetical protein